jgi:uncharacterized damage-inducible protein DinB
MVEWDEDYAPARSARELVDGLKSTWQVMREAMVRWTSEDLDAIFERPNRPERTYTRGWVIWHVLEHDLHHGGELAYSLGMHGLEAPDI